MNAVVGSNWVLFRINNSGIKTSFQQRRVLTGTGFSSSSLYRKHKLSFDVSCSCIASPKNLAPPDEFSTSGSNFRDLPDLEYVNDVLEHEDDSDVLIECKDVYKSFGEKHILRGVSFKIQDGEVVGIIGPSGTGKSTILKIMARLLSPDKGEVIIRGTRRKGLISDEEISGLRIGLVNFLSPTCLFSFICLFEANDHKVYIDKT